MRTLLPSIQRASTIIQERTSHCYDGEHVTYGRSGLDPQKALIGELTRLEGGSGARLFPSGLAAIAGTLLASLTPGDEILVVDGVYGRTRKFCAGILARLGIATRFIAPDTSPQRLAELIGENSRLLFLESPASITFDIQDVAALTGVAREFGMISAVDNTWSAGHLFRPLRHGADISLQSLTKYVGGHSDSFMGCAVFRDPDHLDRFAGEYDAMGWAVGPDDAYLMVRGLKTLGSRLALHAAAARTVAEWLRGRAEVARVLAPMLPGDPSHELWKRDFSGHNGLIGIEIAHEHANGVAAFLDGLEVFRLGFSWGGFESLALDCTPQLAARTMSRPPPGPVIRLHVGLEDEGAMMEDLDRGFRRLRRG